MKKRPKDITGLRVGRLTVVKLLGAAPGRKDLQWLCRCECNRETVVMRFHLTGSRSTQSCGCLQREAAVLIGKANATHGGARDCHELYGIWSGIRRRVNDPKRPCYPEYGGRGITLHAPWYDFAVFRDWVEANIGPRPLGASIDRIDNDGPYAPNNIQWADARTQANNRRQRRWHKRPRGKKKTDDDAYARAREAAIADCTGTVEDG